MANKNSDRDPIVPASDFSHSVQYDAAGNIIGFSDSIDFTQSGAFDKKRGVQTMDSLGVWRTNDKITVSNN